MTLTWLYEHNYNHPTALGVYAICDVVGDRVYVGSTVDLTRRASQHFRSLEEGIHHNRTLQYMWDLHGASSFSFIVLEHMTDRSLLASREQVWLNRFHSKHRRAINHQLTVQRDDVWVDVEPSKYPLPWTDEAWDETPVPTPDDVLREGEACVE